jgi:protein-S-isoprenylcysteine O-methyltransferase Ste14
MSAVDHGGDIRGQPTAQRALRLGLFKLAGVIALLAVSLFLAAGQLGWIDGWVFLAAFAVLMFAAVAYLWWTNPEVVVARSMYHQEGQNAAQGVIFVLVLVLFVAMFVVAAMDAARFHWSSVPVWLIVVGYAVFVLGTIGNIWVLSVNKFAEVSVRIQTERSQKVIDTGPYAIVRHPLYTTAVLLLGGIPLALGSYWALVPFAVVVLVLVLRTALEDRMLQHELAGYKEYAGRVRCRLFPGIW